MTKRVLRLSLFVFAVLLLLSPALAYAQDEPPVKGEALGEPSICQISPGDNAGPDTFGYVYRDDELDPGEWVDISGTGTDITASVGESACYQVPVGFNFYYYGSLKTQVYVCADGYLWFAGPGSSDWTVDCGVVNSNAPNDAIYGFWWDHDASAASGGGSVYYQTLGSAPNRTFIVEFEDVENYWGDNNVQGLITFEMILYETSGDILIQFLDVPGPPYYQHSAGGPAIGIENSTGTDGLTYACDVDDVAEDDMNVLFRYNFDLGDWVWYDTNQNGLQDAGEPGVPGISVDLYDDACLNLIASTTTDSNGFYLFTGLLAGTYCLEFSNIPIGWDITLQNAGLDGIDSDADPSTGRITNINLDTRYDDMDQDMGLNADGMVEGYVWCDTDDSGIEDITVSLFRDPECDGDETGNPLLYTTESAADGYYEFGVGEDLWVGPPGSTDELCYVVVVDDTDPDLADCPDLLSPMRYSVLLNADDPDLELPDFVFWNEWIETFVPEWGSVALLGSGLAGLAGYATLRWRKK